MAEKKSWRDYSKYESGNESTSSEKTGGWRDYSTLDVSSAVGSNIVNSVKTYLDSHNSYIKSHQDRYSSRKGNYEDAYVSDSADWLGAVSSRKSSLDTEADNILSYMDQYKDYLDADWMKEVRNTLTQTRQGRGQILDIASKDNEYWNSWANEELVNEYGSAEEAYKYYQRDDGYRNKYTGMTSKDLYGLIDTMEDGEEKDWLTSYASSVDYDEKSKLDLNKTAEEIEELGNFYDQAYTIGLWYDEYQRGYVPYDAQKLEAYNRLMNEYGGDIETLEKDIEQKEKRLKSATDIQRLNSISAVSGNADFLEKSVYDESNTKYHSFGKPSFADETYAYVNNPTVEYAVLGGKTQSDARGLIERNHSAYSWDTPTRNRDTSYERDALDYMKPEEVKVYNYLYATEGAEKAREYLDLLVGTFQARKDAETVANTAKFADKHPILSSVLSVGTSLGSGFEYLEDIIEYGGDKFMGKDAKLGTNEAALMTNAIRSTVADKVDWEINNWDAFDFLYNTTMSGVDSLASTAFGGAGGFVLGLSAAAQGTNDALNRGMSDSQAFWNGLFSGVFEGLFESLSIGNFNRLKETALNVGLKNIDKTVIKTITKNIGKSMLVNASEEMLTELANITYDTLVNGEFANYTLEELFEKGEWKNALNQIIEAGASGALMGMGMSTIGSSLGYAKGVKNANEYAVKNYGDQTATIIQEGLESDVKSKSYKLAQKYQQNTEKGKTLTGKQIRNILAANQEQITTKDIEKIKSAAAQRLTNLGETKDVATIAELATKRALGQRLTPSEKSKLARSQYGARVANELLPENIDSGEYTTDWAEEIGTEIVNHKAYNKQARELLNKITESLLYKPLEKRMEGEKPANVSNTGKAVIRATGEEIDLTNPKIKSITKDDVVLDANGKDVDTKDIDFATDEQWYAFNAIKKIEHITPGVANSMIANLDMTKPIGPQLNGMDEAFSYGIYKYSEADLEAGLFAGELTDEQRNEMYNLGRYVAKNTVADNKAAIKKMRTAADEIAEKAAAEGKEVPKSKDLTITYNHGGGVVEKLDTAEKKLRKEMSKEQRGGVEVAKLLHMMGIGTDFELFASKTVTDKDGNSVEVYVDDEGQEQAAYAGVYLAADGKIRINLNAYSGTNGLVLNALAHELTHFIKSWSPEKYVTMAEFLTDTYGETGMNMHQRVLREQARLKGIRGKDVSYEEAYDEVVANALNRMFDDGKVLEKLNELAGKDRGLVEKILVGIKQFLKKFFNVYQKNQSLFRDTRDLMEMKEAFEKLQEMFADALVDASENFQASRIVGEALGENAKVETNAQGELLLAANESGNVQVYSEQTYLNGGRDKLEKALRQNGHTDEEITQTLSYVDDALDYIKILAAGYAKEMGYTNLSNHLIADIVTNVKTGKQVMSAIVNNGDYPVNIDLSLICKKRVAYMNLMSRLIRDGVFDKVNYDGAAIAEVNEILRENGFETACLGCFVESRRLQFQTWAETIVSEWNAEVEKRNPNADSFGFAKGKMEELTDADIDALTRELESVKKNDQGNVNLGQGNSVTRMGRLLDALPSLQKKLTVEDLLTPEGLTALRKHDGSLFSIVKSRYGAASPKIVQDFNPYASEIAMLTFAQVKGITNNAVKGAQAYVDEVKKEYVKPQKVKGESKSNFDQRKKAYDQRVQDEAMRRYLYDIGGARIQSFSDFMIENIFDYIQIFADLAAKRLPLHGYTKEIVCLRLFGMTGAKWNGSLIAHVERSMGKEYAGLLPAGTKDGIRVSVNGTDYVIGFDDYARNAATGGKSFIQSIGMKDIIALQLDPRYSPYVGNITIGVSDAQILAMLDSPLFRMVIPYHASGMLPMFAKLVGVDMYNDYTDYQNTTVRQYYDLDGKMVSELKNAKGETVKADTSYAFNAEIQKTKDAKIAANNYLKWCAQRHPVYDGSNLVGYATFNPKFSNSPYGNDFTRHENYYKLLEDFNTYDCVTEASTVQGAVTMNFPTEENRLTEQQMAEYKNALRETGLFTEKDIEKYAKKADMTFKEIINAEVGNRANYAATQAPKWESTVKAVEAKLQKDYARQYSSQQTDLDTNAVSAYDGAKKETKQEVKANVTREEVSHRVDAESSRRVGKENSGGEGSARESCERRIKEILRQQAFKSSDKSAPGRGRVELRETREAFENRSRRDGLMYVEVGSVAMACEVAPVTSWNENAKAAAEKLAQYGFDVVVFTGEMRHNRKEVTETSNAAITAHFADGLTIFISSELAVDGMETAYHEAFHAARHKVLAKHHDKIADIIASNVDAESESFTKFVSEIADLYVYTVSDISTDKVAAEIIEEFYAWYVGKVYATQSGDMQVDMAQFSDMESIKQQIDGVYAQMEANADKALPGLLAGDMELFSSQQTDLNNAPTFYSQMGKVVEGMKQDKFGASSVISMLRGRGVKAEEIRWSGIQAFLDGKKSVTKQELLDFIKGSMLQIEEEELAGGEKEVLWDDFYRRMNDVIPYFSTEEIEEMCFDYDGDFSAEKFESELREYVDDGTISEDDFDEAIEYAEEMGVGLNQRGAQWSKYKLDGGYNYRELLFKMPGSDYSNQAMQAHWGNDTKGVLAHARVQDLDTFIGRMLFVEEIQSDWHNAGQKQGYFSEGDKATKNNTEVRHENGWYNLYREGKDLHQGVSETYLKQRFTNGITEDEIHEGLVDEYNRAVEHSGKGWKAPDAPFKSNYHEYVLKRLLRMAAEQGYDSIGWTTAEIQSDRWSDEFAEGYRIEYDQDIPKFLKKYGKQWDSTVGKTTLDNGIEVWSMAITDSMKKSVLKEGQALYSSQQTDAYTIYDRKAILKEETVDRWLMDYASKSSPNYAQMYITYIRPEKFLDLTTSITFRHNIEMDSKKLDVSEFADYTKDQPIFLEINHETGEVTGHEGRHRCVALQRAGIREVPVLLMDMSNKSNKKPIDSLTLTGQQFRDSKSYASVEVKDIVPFSYANRDEIVNRFATQSKMQQMGEKYGFNKTLRFSTQQTDNITDRDMLANAFETISKNSEEYEMIQDYKSNVKLLNKLERDLDEVKQEIRDIRFGTGKYDAERLKLLEGKADRLAKDITRYDRRLLNMEASAPLRKVIQQERKKAEQETKTHVKEIQQNKKLRAEQTELRHKIRKTIRDLDKILNRGNKKQNVKEDMKGFVSKALELADYLFTDHITNDDLIRRGITVRMSPKEAALVKETEDILSQLYDNIGSLTAEEYTKLDAKRKSNMDKLRDLLTDQRNEGLKTPVYNLFNDLVTEYANLQYSKQDAVKAAYDANVERFLRSYMGEEDGKTDTERKALLQNMRVADMTTKELENLHYAYKMVLHSVREANKLHIEGKTETIEQMAGRIMGDFTKRKIPDKKVAIALQKLTNKIGWDYEKLHYALDRIGSEAFTELVMNLANSENIVMQDIIEAAAFRDEMVENYGFNNWDINKEIDREFLDNTGKKFKLTLGQLMALYAYSRREGAWDHIEYGGFVFGEAALTNPRPADSYKLNKAQCEAITNLLTKEQKGYVEAMQKFLSETMGAKGNEVSMMLYGIKMFGEKNYFPIHIAGQFKAQANESQAKAAAGFSSMSNAGFTHAQNPNAKAPFVLEGFNEVWADHVNEMSRYHGTVPALEDMRKVMNRSFYSEAGADSIALKQMMENAFGKEAVDYFDNLYKEANSGAIRDILEKDSHKFLSLFRKNSVAYSLSVLIQQPASMVRAYALIDKKYFGFKGFGTISSGIAKAVSDKWTKAHTNAYNEMLKYAPGVTMAKEIGGFDTATGGSIRSYLLDTRNNLKWYKRLAQGWKTGTVAEKGKAVMDLVDNNAVANLPNLADKIAWIEIWNACKREAVAKNKNLAPNSEEFMQSVGERFTEVIRATQVYDSIFAKSPMLKSKRVWVQMAVSFMNEPNTVANMAESAVRDATRGNWKGGLRKSAVLIHSIIFTGVLKSIIYAMRDDDEDETYIEKYIEALTGSLMDDFWAPNYIPLLRDAWSVAQGYDVERADMAIVADAINAFRRVIDNGFKNTDGMTEEELIELDKKCTEANWKLVESLAAFFGIPVKNIRREIKGAIDHARIAYSNAGKTTNLSALDKVYDAIIESIPFMKNERTKGDKLYDAIISGDQAYLDRLKSTYKTEDAYQSAVRKALRENDSRIHAAAQAKYEGRTEEYKRIFREIQNEGRFKFDDIMSAINSEETKIRTGVEPDKASSAYSASSFVEAIVTGNRSNANAMKADIISVHMANGKTKEEAEKEFASAVGTAIGDAYSAGLLRDTEAKKMLQEYAGKDEAEATSRVNWWAFCEKYPKYKDVYSESHVEKFNEFAKPAGISVDVYAKFITGTKGLGTIRDEWDEIVKSKREQVLEVIDSLPLTWQQKDALYLAAGYSESKIWDVPW